MTLLELPSDNDPIARAEEHGIICATAADTQRELQKFCISHEAALPPTLDPRFFGAITLANAFGSPRCSASELRMVNRTALWIFASDWLIDHVVQSRDEVDAVVAACLAVADGQAAAPEVPLALLLADLHDDLVARPGLSVWKQQLERYLVASVREWDWLRTGVRPSLEDYLGNSDNVGGTFANLSHWLYTGVPADRIQELWPVSQEVQKVLRLLNDLASADRDLASGDLNVLTLGVTRDEARELVTTLVESCRKLMAAQAQSSPAEIDYLQRQIGFSAGFYGITDYWGEG
jgi:hypothetical protein